MNDPWMDGAPPELDPLWAERAARQALEEDAPWGDATSLAIVAADRAARAVVLAKAEGILAGMPMLEHVFRPLDPAVRIEPLVTDGARIRPGQALARLSGTARALLRGERVALNFLQHASGVATLTRRYVDACAGTRARIADTRKTLPGLRVLQKYAVRVGGGANHRFSLSDAILIKDNHVALAGGVGAAVRLARAGAGHMRRIEVEVTDLAGLDEAIEAGADLILLDNMTPAQMAEAVRRAAGRALLEASGGVTLETVAAIAATGVDLISVGALTHSVRALDLSMEVET